MKKYDPTQALTENDTIIFVTVVSRISNIESWVFCNSIDNYDKIKAIKHTDVKHVRVIPFNCICNN